MVKQVAELPMVVVKLEACPMIIADTSRERADQVGEVEVAS